VGGQTLRTDRRCPTTRPRSWRKITDIHASQTGQEPTNNDLDGVTGTIDYGGDVTVHVPKDKPVAILRVVNGEVSSTLAGSCGQSDERPASSWCPPPH
jgi:hypothetical protein